MSTDPSDPRLAAALARLDALVDWERRDRCGMRPGLEPVVDLLARLGDPQRSFRAVHVTGTKGKGTTSALIAAGLRRAGIAAGLYTSPHVERTTERVVIDGREVGEGELASALERAWDARTAALGAHTAAEEATWFDLMTAAAFLCFARARCPWAVVEVGIGGRLDSTNVVAGEVCVVTNVSLEHTNVLGTTHAAIAREKGGILKCGSTLVTLVPPDSEAGLVLAQIAARLGCAVLRPEAEPAGFFERDLELARLALDELGRRGVTGTGGQPLGRELLDEATARAARLPGRGELLYAGRTPVVLDVAHVAESIAGALREWRARPGFAARPVVVLGLGRDKDVEAVLKALAGSADRLVCTTAATGPLRAADALAEQAARAGWEAETAEHPADALDQAVELAGEEGWVLVTGSFHVVGAVRPLLALDAPERPAC